MQTQNTIRPIIMYKSRRPGKSVKPTPICRHPKTPRPVLQNRGDSIRAQTGNIPRKMLIPYPPASPPIQTTKPVSRPYPKPPQMIFIYTFNIAVRQAVIPIHNHLMPIIPVEPIPRTNPDKSLTILKNGLDGTIGQSLFARQMRKPQFRPLRPPGRRHNHEQKNQKTPHRQKQLFYQI